MTEPTDDDIVCDIKRVAALNGLRSGDKFSRRGYLSGGSRFTYYQLYDGGRNWTQLCTAAGFSTTEKELVSDEVYFRNLVAAVAKLGRFPKTSERKRFGLTFSRARFPTLPAFIKRAIELGYVNDLRPLTETAAEVRIPVEQPNDEIPASAQPSVRPVPPIPALTKRRKWQRTGIRGLPYAPHDELSVVALFAIMCANDVFDWEILEMRGGKGIDATCFDHVRAQEIRVELKHTLSKGSWNHSVEDIDCVVCWENRWKSFPKPVFELCELLPNAHGK